MFIVCKIYPYTEIAQEECTGRVKTEAEDEVKKLSSKEAGTRDAEPFLCQTLKLTPPPVRPFGFDRSKVFGRDSFVIGTG